MLNNVCISIARSKKQDAICAGGIQIDMYGNTTNNMQRHTNWCLTKSWGIITNKLAEGATKTVANA